MSGVNVCKCGKLGDPERYPVWDHDGQIVCFECDQLFRHRALARQAQIDAVIKKHRDREAAELARLGREDVEDEECSKDPEKNGEENGEK